MGAYGRTDGFTTSLATRLGVSMTRSVKPAAVRLYTWLGVGSVWKAATLATRSPNRLLMVELLPTPPLPGSSSEAG